MKSASVPKYREKLRYCCKRIKDGQIKSIIKSADDAYPKSKWNDMHKALLGARLKQSGKSRSIRGTK